MYGATTATFFAFITFSASTSAPALVMTGAAPPFSTVRPCSRCCDTRW